MQFPVPQFTDVEDTIIGGLTIKQFGIVFAAGVLIFLAYSTTKNMIVLGVAALFVGFPAVMIAFVKVNGRPMYTMFPYLMHYMLAPKNLIFYKESGAFDGNEKFRDVEVSEPVEAPMPKIEAEDRLKAVNKILQQQAEEQKQLVSQLK